MVSWNDQGKGTEFKVIVRPLQAVNKLHEQMQNMLEQMKTALHVCLQRVSIIGAGISGLTAGICLFKKNIPSVIYERNSEISDVSAGINLSPNATNLLEKMGVLEDLISLSHQPSKVVFRDHKGKKISSYSVNKGDEKYLTLNRKRLISVLYDKYLEHRR